MSVQGVRGKETAHPSLGRRIVRELFGRYGLVVAWGVLILIFGLLRPDTFLTLQNLQTNLGSQAVLLIVTLSLLVPLTAGELDLSIAGVLSFCVVTLGYLNVEQGWPIGLAILAVLAAGLMIGLIHSALIVGLGLDSIVITLGTGTLLTGLGFGINNLAISGISPALVNAARNELWGIPLAFYYALALTIFIWYLFTYTPFGRYLYFVGAGREVARLGGVRVNQIRSLSLIASSFGTAFGAVVMVGVLGASDPTVGENYLLPVFAGAFLGSTAVRPGRFNAWGTFIAVYFLITGISGLQLVGLAGWVEQVFYGGSLVVAVAASALVSRARLHLTERRARRRGNTPPAQPAEAAGVIGGQP